MKALALVGGGAVGLTLLPILVVVAAVGGTGNPVAAGTADALGLKPAVLSAYEQASTQIGVHYPGCVVPWWVLAGVGKVEWDNGTGRVVDPATGDVVPPVLGPLLDGTNGTAAVTLTAGVPAQALGPMQILPSNWIVLGIRASADGQAPDPQNLADSALTAALMLCRSAGGGDLSDPVRLSTAAHGYNPGGGQPYVDAVVSAAAYYQGFQTSAAGVSAAGLYVLPVTSTYLTPSVLRSLHHDIPAIDIPMPVGTPVFAVVGGIASPTTDGDACGTGVRITGDDGYSYIYCHGSALVGITPGGRVVTGQLVMLSGGAVGEPGAGNSQGPHLHFQITTPGGLLICPGPYLEAWSSDIPLPPSEGQTQACVR